MHRYKHSIDQRVSQKKSKLPKHLSSFLNFEKKKITKVGNFQNVLNGYLKYFSDRSGFLYEILRFIMIILKGRVLKFPQLLNEIHTEIPLSRNCCNFCTTDSVAPWRKYRVGRIYLLTIASHMVLSSVLVLFNKTDEPDSVPIPQVKQINLKSL